MFEGLGTPISKKGTQILLNLTSGIKEVFLERSGRKIWVKPEPRGEPFIPCYTPRRPKGGERSVVGAKRRSSKNIFRSQLSDRLYFILINLIFSVLKNERGVRGEFHF
jgi:hypothetical protein